MTVPVLPPGSVLGEVAVRGSLMRFIEVGPETGPAPEPRPAVVFLHGNPTSSFLWRNVMGPVAAAGWRCLALDLIGMGASEKPDIAYRLIDHIGYVAGFLDAMALRRPVLVGHDWGAVIGLRCASEHPGGVAGVAFMEGHIHPIRAWPDLGEGADMFRSLRTAGLGERMVMEDNFFIETVLPAGMQRQLSDAEFDAYRAPYLDPAARTPMLVWTREIPIAGQPADVADLVLGNQSIIADPEVEKLLLHADPGAVIRAAEVAWCREHGRSLELAGIGAGTHFLPEDRPGEIAAALCRWLADLQDG